MARLVQTVRKVTVTELTTLQQCYECATCQNLKWMVCRPQQIPLLSVNNRNLGPQWPQTHQNWTMTLEKHSLLWRSYILQIRILCNLLWEQCVILTGVGKQKPVNISNQIMFSSMKFLILHCSANIWPIFRVSWHFINAAATLLLNLLHKTNCALWSESQTATTNSL